MSTRSSVSHIRVYPLSIPLRKPFSHSAHVRATADPVIVEIELLDGTLGYGETLPRPYVSGETVGSVLAAIESVFAAELISLHPGRFPDALERIDLLPHMDENGDTLVAARAAVELALLDAYSRHFRRPIAEAVGWLGLAGTGPPGSIARLRYSGVVSGEPRKLARSVRLMRWYGLRDFKLKVGYDNDVERIRAVARVLGRSLGRKTSLRIDANGAWSLPTAAERLHAVAELPIACVEQPFPRQRDEDLIVLKQSVDARILHDESLLSMADAERLVQTGVADAFNIRIAKNGGFLSAVRLAHFARRHGILCQLGCMVGETSILSAAGRHFIENVPGISFAEGSYGSFLLRGDVTARPLRFGYGGRIRPLAGPGWGIDVRRELLEQYSIGSALDLPL